MDVTSPAKTPHAAFLALTYDTGLASGNGYYFNGSSAVYKHPDNSPITSGVFFGSPGNPHSNLGPYYIYSAGWNAGFYGGGSIHTGGGQILMADGAVRFLGSNTSYNVWAGLNTRQGGEIIPEF
jgi:prepilin-type processing-associated H-X9-DG protein